MIKLEPGWLDTGQTHDHQFTSKVLNASVELSGFELKYSDNKDHHVLGVMAKTAITAISGTKVTVQVAGDIHDSSGKSGGGKVGYLLIAEVE